jgi:glycosyltransferase involved in cell wall biosynthesis
MPAHNACPYIAEAVESVLAQTFSDFELVIVDDGSTDGTREVLSRFHDDRIRILHHDERLGVVAARNTAGHAARGEYLAVLDADDRARPDRFRVQVDYLNSHADVVAAGGAAQRITVEGQPLGIVRHVSHPDLVAWMALFCNPVIHSTLMVRRVDWVAVGGYDSADLYGTEDYGLILRLVGRGRVSNLPLLLADYRLSPTQLTATTFELQTNQANRLVQSALRQELGSDISPDVVDAWRGLVLGRIPSTDEMRRRLINLLTVGCSAIGTPDAKRDASSRCCWLALHALKAGCLTTGALGLWRCMTLTPLGIPWAAYKFVRSLWEN